MANTIQLGVDFEIAQSNKLTKYLAQVQNQANNIKLDFSGGQALGSFTRGVKDFDNALTTANKRVIAFGASASIVLGTVSAFKAVVSATVEVEKSLAQINVLFNLSSSELSKFSKSLFDVARNTSQSFGDTAKAAEEFSRQGLSAAETLKRTRDALILTRLSGLDLEKSISTLTAGMATFGQAGQDTTSILNKLVAVDGNFAVSAKDIAEALSRVGSVATDAKISLDEFAGLVTAAKQITSRDGAVIGNSLKTIFTRLERTDTIDKLESLGIAVRDAGGNVRPVLDVFNALAKSYQNLSKEQQNQVAQLGGGVFQINQFKALLLDLGKANGIAAQATKTSIDATNEALLRNSKLNETLSSSFENLKTSASQVGSTVGTLAGSGTLKTLLGVGNSGLDLFKDLDPSGATEAGENFGRYFGESLLKGAGDFLAGPGLVLAAKLFGKVAFSTLKEVGSDIKSVFNSGRNDENFLKGINGLLAQGTEEERKQFAAATDVATQHRVINGILEKRLALQVEISATNASLVEGIGSNRSQYKQFSRLGKNFAEGYLSDSIRAENKAISNGVGGATAAAKPIIIKDFDFGGGQIGTIVANTDEYIVPGASGKGSSILNRNMIQRFGLPAGAVKIAAGGYGPSGPAALDFRPGGIEDFAKSLDISNIGFSTNVENQRRKLKKLVEAELDLDIESLKGPLKTSYRKLVNEVFAIRKEDIGNLANKQQSAGFAELDVIARNEFNKLVDSKIVKTVGSAGNATAQQNPNNGKDDSSRISRNNARNLDSLDRPTFQEKVYKKPLTNLSNDQLDALLQASGGNGNAGFDRNEVIKINRNELRGSFSEKGRLSSGFNDSLKTTLGLADSGTLFTDFNQRIKNLVTKGRTLEESFAIASQGLLDAGGSSKQLKLAIVNSAQGLQSFEKEFKNLQAATAKEAELIRSSIDGNKRVATRSISNQTDLLSATKNLSKGGGVDSLDPALKKALIDSITKQTSQELYGNTGASLPQLLKNPQSRAQIAKSVEEKLIQLNKESLEASSGFKRDTSNDQSRQVRAQRISRANNAAFGIGIAGSIASGFLPEVKGGNSELGALSGGLSGAGLGASIGSLFPGFGTAIGAGVGGFVGAVKGFIDKSSKSFEEVAKELEESNLKITKRLSSVSAFQNAQLEIKSALERGEKQEVIDTLIKKRDLESSSLSYSDRKKLYSAGFDLKKNGDFTSDLSLQESSERKKNTLITDFGILPQSNSFFGKPEKANDEKIDALTNKIAILSKVSPSSPSLDISELKSNYDKKISSVSDISDTEGLSGAYSLTVLNKAEEDFAKGLQEKIIDTLSGIENFTEENKKQLLTSLKFAGSENLLNIIKGIKQKSTEFIDSSGKDERNTFIENSRSAISQQLRGRERFADQSSVLNTFSESALSARQRTSFGLGGRSETARQEVSSRLAEQTAERQAQFSNLQAFEKAKADFIKEGRDRDNSFGLEAGKANNIQDLESLFKKTFPKENDKDSVQVELKNILEASNKTVIQNQTQIELAKEQNALDKLALQGQQQARLLSGGTYNSGTNANINTIFSRIGNSSGAARTANKIDFSSALSGLGLPSTDESVSYDTAARNSSVRDTLSAISSRRLKNRVGTDDVSLGGAADELSNGTEEDRVLASQIKEAVRLLSLNIPEEQSKLENGGVSADFLKVLVDSKQITKDTQIISGPLEKISSYTLNSNTFLEKIAGLLEQKNNLEEQTDLAVKNGELESQKKAAPAGEVRDKIDKDILLNKDKIEELKARFNERQVRLGEIKEASPSIGAGTPNTSTGFSLPNSSTTKLGVFSTNLEKVATEATKIGVETGAGEAVIKLPRFTGTQKAPEERSNQFGSFKEGFSTSLDRNLTGSFHNAKESLESLRDVGEQVSSSLHNNLSNSFGDFVTGAKSAKDAFRSFTLSVLNDAARAFASKAVSQFIGVGVSAFGGSLSGYGKADGGPITRANGGDVPHFANGGRVPALLMGGEYVFDAKSAKNVGHDTLRQLNSGNIKRFATGGMVRGGSGTRDDVPARLEPGSYVIKKSMVNRYGADYLSSLGAGRVQKRDAGGMIYGGVFGALIGGAIGYATGGKKGALIGAIGGGVLGAAGGYFAKGASSVATPSSGSTGLTTNATNAFGTPASSMAPRDMSLLGSTGANAVAGSSGAASVSSFGSLNGALINVGVAGAIGLAGTAFAGKESSGRLMTRDEMFSENARLSSSEASSLANAKNSGQIAYLQQNPQGGFSLAGYGATPATRRFEDAGPVSTMTATPSPMSTAPTSSGGSGAVSVSVTVNNMGGEEKKDKKGDEKDKFGEVLASRVKAITLQTIIEEKRIGGSLRM